MWKRSQTGCLMGMVVSLALCVPVRAQSGIPVPMDWSHKHLVITNAASPEQRMAAARDPRNISNWLRRTQALAGAKAHFPKHPTQRAKASRDWSVSLGAGRVAPTMSPAKYGLYTSSTQPIASCSTDYVVYGLDAAATPNTGGGQANLVFLRNLYSGSNGYCGAATIAASPSGAVRNGNVVTITTTAPHTFKVGMQVAISGVADTSFNGTFTVASVPSATSFTFPQTATNAGSGGGTASFATASIMAAYNVTTQTGGAVLTSPSISLDGKKIAFVESTPTGSIFHVLTLDPCTYSTAGCANNGTSATSSAVPGSGNAASLVSIQYSNSNNTRSSPWIDYGGAGTAYVGDDNGTLFRIVNVFAGTPAVDASFGGSGQVVVNSGTMLTGPVLAQGWLFVGDDSGLLWPVAATNPYTILGALQVGGGHRGSTIFGIEDPPVIDASTAGMVSVFAASGADPSANHATLVQATLNISTQTFSLVTRADLGTSFIGPIYNIHAPAFDNNYYLGQINANQGFIYACGELSPFALPRLMRFAFTAGAPPAMKAAANGTFTLHNFPAECSPLTEFANSNLAVKDLLFVGDSSGEVQSFDITGAMPSRAAASATEAGGTSGIIVDTTQLPSQQGSSIYFTTQSTSGGNCGTGNYCAIKVTQAGLL